MGQGEYTTWLSILAGGSYHSYLSFIRSDDLMDVAHRYDEDCIYLATVQDEKSAEYGCGLFRYNLVDEIVLYLLPFSYGKGMSLTADFHFSHWKLCACKSYSNGICRLIYARNR